MDRDETEVAQELATSLAPRCVSIEGNRKGFGECTDVPGIEERKDCADGKDVIILVKHHDERLAELRTCFTS